MNIIHISDIHACNNVISLDQDKIIDNVKEAISGIIKKKKIIIIVSGDITNKGEATGYKTAEKFIGKINLAFENKIEYIFCPGNHDIDKNKEFKEYNKFVYAITRNPNLVFEKKSVLLNTIGEIDFIIINSSHHGERTFGQININDVESILKKTKKSNYKIIVLHHHLIPTIEDDRSAVVNSYEFLTLAEHFKVNKIIHGHQHMNFTLNIGKKKSSFEVIGTGSLFKDNNIYNRQFNLLIKTNTKYTNNSYKFINDAVENGKIGIYKKI